MSETEQFSQGRPMHVRQDELIHASIVLDNSGFAPDSHAWSCRAKGNIRIEEFIKYDRTSRPCFLSGTLGRSSPERSNGLPC